MAKTSPPDSVGTLVDRVLQRVDPDNRRRVYAVWGFWREEVGEAIAARAQPLSFRNGILSVRVSTHTWLQELQFHRETIRGRLNARLGGELIREIYLVSSGAPVTSEGRRREPRPARFTEPPSDEAPAAIPTLEDPRLASVFARILRAHRRRRPPDGPR